MLRPAGMSSDEDESDYEDNYFSMYLRLKREFPSRRSEQMPSSNVDDDFSDFSSGNDEAMEATFLKAADAGNFELMRNLIARGVPVDWSENGEWTAMMNVCSKGKIDVVQFLLDNGANANTHVDLHTPLMACCSRTYAPEEDRLECVRLLLEAGADVNASDIHRSSALILAVTNGLELIATELIHVPGVKIDWKDKEDWTALMYAVKHNHTTLVEELVRAGAQVDETSRVTSYTAVSLAEMGNNAEILRVLVPEYTPDDVENDVRAVAGSLFPDPMDELLDQLPDEKGCGGFSQDVRHIFAGIELHRLYDNIKPNLSLPEFLLMEDFSRIGVKFEVVQRKLRRQGIHRFLLHPWPKGALHVIPEAHTLRLENYVNFIGNITKSLTILHTTLEYVHRESRTRGQAHATDRDKSMNAELINLLVEAYIQVEKLNKKMRAIRKGVEKIVPIGGREADYVGPAEPTPTEKVGRFFTVACFAFGAITVASALFNYKFLLNILPNPKRVTA